jgi:uncharacterized protein involved in outer membrane biogenesis
MVQHRFGRSLTARGRTELSIGKIIAWILGLLVLLIAGVVAYLSFADLTWVKQRIETGVTESTGREFSIDGNFELDVLPEPSVLVEDVRLANAPWATTPAMATVGRFSARLNLWSLLSGPIVVHEIRLNDVDIQLESNEEGVSNAEMGESEPEQPDRARDSGDAEVPVIIELAEIRNVKLTSRAPGSEPTILQIDAFDIVLDEAENMVLNGKGQALELPFSVNGTIGPASALQASRDINVNLEAALGGLNSTVSGVLGELQTQDGTDLSIKLTSADIAALAKQLDVDLPLTGALAADLGIQGTDGVTDTTLEAQAGAIAATAKARREDDTVDFEFTVPALDKAGAALEIDGLPALDLEATGQLVMDNRKTTLNGVKLMLGEALFRIDGSIPADERSSTRLDIKAQGPSLQELKADLPVIPFAAAITAALSGDTTDLDIANVSFGQSDMAGTVTVTTGERTSVVADLRSNLIDLNPFSAEEEGEGASAETEEESEPEQEYVFTEEPLPFEALRGTDLDITSSIAKMIQGPRQVLDIRTTAQLKDGLLTFRNRFSGHLGGQYASDLDLDASGEPAKMKALINLRDLKVNISSGEDATPEEIPTTDVTLDVTSAGSSQRELASGLDGRMLLTQGPGRLENALVGGLTGDLFAQLFSAINPLAKDEEYSNWDCTIFSMDIESGLADINGFLLQGAKIMVVGGGDIDFNSEELNVEFNTKPREGVGISADMFVTPFIKLVGTFQSPRIGLDKKASILQGGAAILTGGLSILAKGAADRASAEGDRCAPTLAEVGDHGPIQD